MVCRTCNNTGVLSDAGVSRSIPFYYCRTCKKEIELEEIELEVVEREYADEDPIDVFRRILDANEFFDR